MKKFLAILLIAIVACSTVPVEEEKVPEKVKNVLLKLLKPLKKVVQFLKEKGYWDQVVKFLKATGLIIPKDACVEVYDEETCDELLGSLLQNPEDGEVVLNSVWEVVYKGMKYFVEAVSFVEAVKKVISWFS